MHLAPALPAFRRAGFVLVLLAAFAGNAWAQTTSGISLRIGGAPVETRIAVTADARRMVFGTLRSTAPLAKVELIDPAGRTVRSDTGTTLKRMPAEQAVHPELGAVYFLPELRDAAPGTWRLRFVPARCV